MPPFSQGTQGIYDAPSKGDLENQFDTTDEDAIIKKILEEGEAQEMEVRTTIAPHFTAPDCLLTC